MARRRQSSPASLAVANRWASSAIGFDERCSASWRTRSSLNPSGSPAARAARRLHPQLRRSLRSASDRGGRERNGNVRRSGLTDVHSRAPRAAPHDQHRARPVDRRSGAARSDRARQVGTAPLEGRADVGQCPSSTPFTSRNRQLRAITVAQHRDQPLGVARVPCGSALRCRPNRRSRCRPVSRSARGGDFQRDLERCVDPGRPRQQIRSRRVPTLRHFTAHVLDHREPKRSRRASAARGSEQGRRQHHDEQGGY